MRRPPSIRAVLAAAVVVATACVHGVLDVAAEAPTEGGTVTVGPSSNGPTVSSGSAGFDQSGIVSGANSRSAEPPRGAAPQPGTPDAGAVTLRPIPNNALPCGNAGPVQQGTGGAVLVPACVPTNACPVGETGFYVYDANGAPIGVVCVSTRTAIGVGGQAVSPLQLAQTASARQPWPALLVGVNPGVGLTGLASWFWLSGDPAMADASASAGPLTVTVRAALDEVTWDFGDGSSTSSGTDRGNAFPVASRIQHVYQTDTFGRTGGVVVSALVRYRVTYSVNGGPFVPLGLKAQAYRTTYQVNQLQPQAVSLP